MARGKQYESEAARAAQLLESGADAGKVKHGGNAMLVIFLRYVPKAHPTLVHLTSYLTHRNVQHMNQVACTLISGDYEALAAEVSNRSWLLVC
jgi:hypothetical protein